MNDAIELLGWALIHSLWWGAMICAGAALLLRLARRAAPAWRYAGACIALLALVGGPVVMLVGSFETGVPALRIITVLDTPDTAAVGNMDGSAVVDTLPDSAPAEAPATAWLHWLSAVWALGTGLFALRLGVGWCGAQRLRRLGTRPLTALEPLRLDQLAARLGVRRAVQFFETSVAAVPSVVGWFRPVILIPAELIRELTPPQLEAIILHELAHIRRHDYLVNLLQRIVEVVLFYHPAAWWLSRVIEAERERCCDDLVIAARAKPGVYAGALLSIAALAGGGEGRWAPAATGGDLGDRVRRIFDRAGRPASTQRRTLATLMTIASGALVVTCVLVLVVACSPKAVEQVALESAISETPQSEIIRVPWGRLMRGQMQYNIAIRPGDVIRVPGHQAGFVYIMGETNRPGAYTVPGVNQLTVRQLIASSGGIPVAEGAPIYYTVTRRIDEDTEVVALAASWEQLGAGEAKDTYLYPGDLIQVSTTPPKTPILVTPTEAIPAKPDLLGRLPRAEDLVPPDSIDNITPGDKLRVTIFELLKPGENHIAEPTVDENGRIELTVLGEVEAAGITATELRQRIVEKAIALGVFREAPVQVDILSSGQTFTILGEPDQGSTRQGVYGLPKSGYSLLEAIAQAGGVSSSTETVYIYRGTQPVTP